MTVGPFFGVRTSESTRRAPSTSYTLPGTSGGHLCVWGQIAPTEAPFTHVRRGHGKMLFPLVFLVLPAFLLLTVVPVLLSTLRSIR
jgi:hypothetical protein